MCLFLHVLNVWGLFCNAMPDHAIAGPAHARICGNRSTEVVVGDE